MIHARPPEQEEWRAFRARYVTVRVLLQLNEAKCPPKEEGRERTNLDGVEHAQDIDINHHLVSSWISLSNPLDGGHAGIGKDLFAVD